MQSLKEDNVYLCILTLKDIHNVFSEKSSRERSGRANVLMSIMRKV